MGWFARREQCSCRDSANRPSRTDSHIWMSYSVNHKATPRTKPHPTSPLLSLPIPPRHHMLYPEAKPKTQAMHNAQYVPAILELTPSATCPALPRPTFTCACTTHPRLQLRGPLTDAHAGSRTRKPEILQQCMCSSFRPNRIPERKRKYPDALCCLLPLCACAARSNVFFSLS